MNSKQRVRAAVEGKPVDRIPLGFYAVDCDTIARVIGRKTFVRDKIGSQIAFWQGRRDEVVESYKRDTVEFYRKIESADLICFKEAPVVPPKGYRPDHPPKQLDDDTWEDREGRIYKVSHLSNELVCVHDPHQADAEDFTEDMFPGYDESEYRPPDPSIFEACDHIVRSSSPRAAATRSRRTYPTTTTSGPARTARSGTRTPAPPEGRSSAPGSTATSASRS